MGYSVAEPEPVGAGTFWLELEPEQETEPVWRCEGKNNLLAYFYMKRSRSRWQKSTWSRSRSKKDRLRNTDGVGQDNFILPGWCKLVLLLCCCSNTNVVQAEVTEEEPEPLVGHCRCKNCGIVPTPQLLNKYMVIFKSWYRSATLNDRVSDPYSLNLDPAKNLNPDPDPERLWIRL